MHTVDIGIGGDDYFVVSKAFDALFDVERSLQQIEFLVVVNDFLGFTETVERFTSEREHSLGFHIACFGYGTRSRVALGDENR